MSSSPLRAGRITCALEDANITAIQRTGSDGESQASFEVARLIPCAAGAAHGIPLGNTGEDSTAVASVNTFRWTESDPRHLEDRFFNVSFNTKKQNTQYLQNLRAKAPPSLVGGMEDEILEDDFVASLLRPKDKSAREFDMTHTLGDAGAMTSDKDHSRDGTSSVDSDSSWSSHLDANGAEIESLNDESESPREQATGASVSSTESNSVISIDFSSSFSSLPPKPKMAMSFQPETRVWKDSAGKSMLPQLHGREETGARGANQRWM